MTNIPVSVWEQVPVVVIYTILLAGVGVLVVRAFSKAVADINQYYAQVIKENNEQWQKYIDARAETSKLINDQVVEKLQRLTGAIEKLDANFERHDTMEREVFDQMNAKAAAARKRKPRQKTSRL